MGGGGINKRIQRKHGEVGVLGDMLNAVFAKGPFVRMQSIEMFNKTFISLTFFLFISLSLSRWMECRSSLKGVKGQGPGEGGDSSGDRSAQIRPRNDVHGQNS